MTTTNMALDAKYAVYGHYGDDGVCFYVGIGSYERAHSFGRTRRSKFWHHYAKKHCSSGKPTVKIWHSNLTWEKAIEHEKFWISVYGRRDLGTGVLVNMTDGGDGMVGHIPSEETLAKLRRPCTEEKKRKISASNKGKLPWCTGIKRGPHSKEAKLKMSNARKGRVSNRKGVILSIETRQKISEAKKGKPPPNKGKPCSEETKRKISETKKLNKLKMEG